MNARAIYSLEISSESSIRKSPLHPFQKSGNPSDKTERDTKEYWKNINAKKRRKTTKVRYPTFRIDEYFENTESDESSEPNSKEVSNQEVQQELSHTDDDADQSAIDEYDQGRGDITIPVDERYYYLDDTYSINAEGKVTLTLRVKFIHINDRHMIEEEQTV
jgi:hypothetical protein